MRIAAYVVFAMFIDVTLGLGQQSQKTLVAERYLCRTEIRAGNSDNSGQNQLVHSGPVQPGDRFSTNQTFISVRYDTNPGVCGELRNDWFRCSWDECKFP